MSAQFLTDLFQTIILACLMFLVIRHINKKRH